MGANVDSANASIARKGTACLPEPICGNAKAWMGPEDRSAVTWSGSGFKIPLTLYRAHVNHVSVFLFVQNSTAMSGHLHD